MNTRKRKYIIYSIILLLVITLSVGFSAFQKKLLIDDSIFNVRLQVDTRVSGYSIQKTSGNAISNSEDYNVKKIYGSVTFPTTSSYVLYKVDLTNYGNVKTGLLDITSNTSGINYQVCDSNGNNCTNDPKTSVCNGSNCTLGSTKTIYVKVTSTSTGTKNVDLDLEFSPIYTLTYENFSENTTSFKTEIMEGETYEVTLTSSPEEISGVNATTNYNKTNHKLTISGATNNVTITAKYLFTDIAETTYTGTNPNNYVKFNDSLYRIITKSTINDGYGNEELRGKIVSYNSIGNNPFDDDEPDYSLSSIKDVLNDTYYNSLSESAKELVDSAIWGEDYIGNIGLIEGSDFTSNSSWMFKNGYTVTPGSDNKVIAVVSGTLADSAVTVSRATYPSIYLSKDTLIVGGSGTSTDPYLLDMKSDGKQSNLTIIKGRNLTVTGSAQPLVTVENKVGTPRYSTTTVLTQSNYTSGSTTIPTGSAVGNYTIYYYIPAMDGFKAKQGSVTTTISGIKYTINYTKGDNVSEIGKTSDTCTTSGTSLTCNLTLPSITPNAGWENGKWNYNSNTYNPGSSFTLNSSNTGLTMTSSVTGKTYTATIYYYNGSAVATTTRTCTVSSGNSCAFTLTTAVTGSKGVYNSAYKGIASATNSMTSAALSMTKNTTFYAIYSGSVSNRYRGTSSYTTRTLYRNEFFKSNSALDVRLATANNSTTNYTPENGPGGSTWLGLSTANDTTAEYNSVETAAASTSTSLYTIYQFSITYAKGANVSAIGSTGGTCKVTSATSCNVTLPSITPNTGYTSVGWSTTNGATTGVTGTYTISTSGQTLYANAKGSTYTATFYYYDGTQINTTTSNCTVANTEGNCTVSVPVAVQSSTGPYGSPYKGVSDTASTMEAASLTISTNGTKFYANYSSGDNASTKVTRYYYSSGYKSNTIYRNEYFISDNAISTVLSTADNGTTNYTSSKGPGSSNWLGLSTAQDTTPEYTTVQAAANSTSRTLYTVYQFVINYQKGANASAVGSDSATCNVTTSDTSCSVILPTITPNTGYTSVGWSDTNGATTGQAALTTYTLTANNRVLYANAVAANYLNTTTNESYMTLNEACSAVSNNQTIKVLRDTTETTTATLASTKTGIKLDLNGKTITLNNAYISNSGTLDIYNTSSANGTINGGPSGGTIQQLIYNKGTLTLNGTSSTNKIVIDKTSDRDVTAAIINSSSKSLTVNNNVEVKVSAGLSDGIENSGVATIIGGTITGSSEGISNNKEGQLNISGSSTQITSTSSDGIDNVGTLTISGGTITGTTTGIDNSGTSTISGGFISGATGIQNYKKTYSYSYAIGELNISGSVQITGTNTYGIDNTGTTTISGGTITGPTGLHNYHRTVGEDDYFGNTLITGGTITGTTKGIQNDSFTTLTLGTKDSIVSTSSPLVQTTGTSNNYGVYIESGGTFNFYDGIVKSSSGTGKSISGTVADTPDDYVIRKSTTDGIETATLGALVHNYQNTTTNVYYETLNEAFSAVESNQTIKVMQNTTETTNAWLLDTKTGIKLDLNGKTITMNNTDIRNYGTLDIYNTSSTTGTINNGANQLLYNEGTLTLNGTSSTNKIVIDKTTNNNSNGAIFNNTSKSLTVNNNVEIKVSTGSSYGIFNNGIATITGGTITGASVGISNSSTGQLEVSGSSTQISGTSSDGISNYGTATINGGTITGASVGIYNNSTGQLEVSGSSTQISGIENSGTTTITGGTITGSSYGIYLYTGTLTLGTKDSNVSTSSPLIQTTSSSNRYGVYIVSGGTFNFYDGIIKSSSGSGKSIYGTVADTPDGYHVYKETTSGVESAYLTNTKRTATFYYNSNTTSGGLTIATKTVSCNVTSGNSCTVSVPSEVSNSVGKYNSAYKGVGFSGSMSSASLTISENKNFFAYYSSPLKINYINSSGSIVNTSSLLYRNEYFTSTTVLATITASSQSSTTQTTSISLSNLKGTFKGITSTINSTTNYAVNNTTIINSNATAYYAVSSTTKNITFYSGYNGSSHAKTDTVVQTLTHYIKTASTTGVSNGSITTPTLNSISNWTSLGWRDDTVAGAKEYSSGTSITPAYSEYHAVYSRNITYTYNAAGGSGTVNNTTHTVYLNSSNPSLSSQESTLSTQEFTKSGYSFGGWMIDGTTVAAGGHYTPDPLLSYNGTTYAWTISATAQWASNTATIKIFKDGLAWNDRQIEVDETTQEVIEVDLSTSPTQYTSAGITAVISPDSNEIVFNNTVSGTTYYIYASKHNLATKMMINTGFTITGGVSQEKSINYYTITRSQGTGTSLETKWDSASGDAFSHNPVVLGNNKVTIYAKSAVAAGYLTNTTLSLKHGTTNMTASGDTFSVNGTETITSTSSNPEPITYTVTYHSNPSACGTPSGVMSPSTHTYGTPKNLSANEFASSTCVFQGWNTLSNGTGEIYSDEEEVLNLSQTNNGNIDLYAQWQGIEYVVAFDGNDATSGEMEDLLVHYGETFTLPENEFTKIGYSYGNGWSTSSDGEKVYNEEQTNVSNLTDQANETVTLYSVWNPNVVTVNYYKDDSCSTDLVESVTKHYNELYGTLPTPTIPGYDFVEWNTAVDGSGTTITEETIVDTLNSSINICAVKTPKTIAITYDNNYSLLNNGYNNVTWNGNTIDFAGSTTNGVMMGTIDYDYMTLESTFIPNISTTGTASYVIGNLETGGGAIFVSSNGTLAGQFYINGAYQQIDSGITSVNGTKYTVVLTYDGSTEKLYVNGELKGSINVSGVIAKTKKATSMALGGNPLRDGVNSGAFKGQILSAKIYDRGITADEVSQNYEAINDDDIVYEGLVKNIDSSHRTVNKVEILRTYDGGTLGTSLAPNLPSPGRAFFKFAGWYTEPECTNQVTASTPMPTEDTTYYAKWTPNKIQLEYYSNGATTFKGSTTFTDPISVSGEVSYTNHSAWSSSGLGNYSGSGGAVYMTKTNYVATGNWLVGSTSSSTKIHEDRVFYGAPGLVELLPTTYVDLFRTNTDVTTVVPIYAEWATSPTCAKVTLSKECGTGGTSTFYYKPGTNTYYSNSGCSTALTMPITMPTSDFTINGYYEAPAGHGRQFIDDSGNPMNSLYKVQYSQTLYAKCSTTLYEYYQLNAYDYDTGVYANTDYKVNWSRNFRLYARFTIPSLGKRYMILDNYDGSDINALSIEINADNKLRVYTGNSTTHEATVSTNTVPANTQLQVTFIWSADSKGWYTSVTNLSDSSTVATIGSSSSPHSWTSASGYSENPLRAGTVDFRTGTSPYNPINYSYLQARHIKRYGEKLGPLPNPEFPDAEFVGWFDSDGNQVSSDDIVTTASPKIYAHWLPKSSTISVYKDGKVWNDSGMTVGLYQNGNLKYGGTLTSGNSITINNTIPGTYDIYASENPSSPNNVVDTGYDLKVTTGGNARVDYYTLTLNSGTGISSVGVNNTSDTSGIYLKGKSIPIKATVQTDYKFSTWTKNTGSSPASATSASTNVVLNAKTTLTANAAKNKVNVTIKKDGSAWSSSGMKVALYQSGTSKYTLTTSGSVASKEGITAGTYDIYAYKNDSNTTYADTGVDVKVSTGTVSATINYYTLTLSKGTGVDSVSGAGIYLNKQKPTIKATMKTNYKFNEWTVSSGVSPASLTSATTTVTMTKKTSLSATSKRTWNDGHTHTFYTSLQATKKSGWLFDNYRIAKYHFTGNWECSCGRTHKANTSVYGYHLQCVYCGLTERELESKLGYQIDGRYWCPITGNERTNHNYSY